jgi:putative phage-type endonuclease
MQTHNLVQGSPEWHAHRDQYDNASDLPAAAGESPYKSRDQLMTEYVTGLTQDVDALTQRRFDNGHHFEALARPVAESRIGKDIYPVIGTEGTLSASFDGLTMMDDIAWEHKTLNDSIRACETADELPEMYKLQMDQQLLISGAEKCLFSATTWDDGDNLLEEKHLWYTTTLDRKQRVVDIWAQFHRDLETFVPTVKAEPVKAQAILALPALAIQIKGEVTLSNLPEFKEAATAFIANINTELLTDEDFANAEANVTFCKEAEENIEATKKSAIAQTASIDELMRTLDFISAQLRDKRLDLSGKVKTEKENRKLQIIKAAQDDLVKHFMALSAEIKPIGLNTTPADFAGAIKGKKTITGMQGAVNQVLADSKIILDATARDIRTKQAWLKENADGYQFLFADIQTVIYKPMDDLQVLVKSRIAEHKQAEAAIKEKAEADALAKVEAERIAAQVKPEITAPEKNVINETDFIREIANTGLSVSAITIDSDTGITKANIPTSYFYGVEPTANEIVSALATAFKVDELQAHAWLIKADFTQYNPAKKAA